MTIADAINRVDDIQPNSYSDINKVEWLSSIDRHVNDEILNNYRTEPVAFNGYDESTRMNTELLIPDLYAAEVYVPYLQSKIDFANNEIARYNNSVAMYNNAFSGFRNHYNATHKHNQTEIIY